MSRSSALAPRGAALIGQRREIGVGAGVNPAVQRLAARLLERLQLAFAVFERQHSPATGLEDVVEPAEHPVGGSVVEALAVVIDNPPAVAHVVLVAFDQRFVDVAFVEFGITHQRDHSARFALRQFAVSDQVILDQAGEQRDRYSEPHRAGRKIDRDLVLGPRRVALCPTQPAEALELIERLVAEQVMDRVEHRPRMRLDRNLVVGPQRIKIERGHDRRDRRARGLVSADFQSVAALAQMVGVVNGPRSQPPQPRVKRLQRGDAVDSGQLEGLAHGSLPIIATRLIGPPLRQRA